MRAGDLSDFRQNIDSNAANLGGNHLEIRCQTWLNARASKAAQKKATNHLV